jgi:hypothetical protein
MMAAVVFRILDADALKKSHNPVTDGDRLLAKWIQGALPGPQKRQADAVQRLLCGS